MNVPRGIGTKVLPTAFAIALCATGILRAELVVAPVPQETVGASATSDDLPNAFGLAVTEDPGPISTFWKKLRPPHEIRTDSATVVPFDVENFVYLFYFVDADSPPVEPAEAALLNSP